MYLRRLGLVAIGFLTGIVVSLIGSKLLFVTSGNSDASIVRHWKVVNEYTSYIRDPDNYRHDPQTGYFHATALPLDPEASLAALVAGGELQHLDLVFPLVPNNPQTHRYWTEFTEARKDGIVFAEGNPQYSEFQPAGKPLLHLRLWFKESAKEDVRQLIKELDERFAQSHETD